MDEKGHSYTFEWLGDRLPDPEMLTHLRMMWVGYRKREDSEDAVKHLEDLLDKMGDATRSYVGDMDTVYRVNGNKILVLKFVW